MAGQMLVRGDFGESVSKLTGALHSLGFLAKVSSTFDESVVEAVRALQQSRGLKVTGECDQKTLQALEEARWRLGDRAIELTTPMMRGDDVATLQRRLVGMGFDVGRADGIF